MENPQAEAALASLEAAVQKAHRSTLGLLAACAVVIFMQEGEPDRFPDRLAIMAALVLAFGTIVLKQLGSSAVMAARPRVILTLCGLGCGAGLGLVGAWVAFDQHAIQPALGMALGGAILCLRPPPPLRSASRRV